MSDCCDGALFNFEFIENVLLFMFIYFQGIASFVTLAEAAGICIAVSEKILRRAEDADYDRIIERLSQKSSARGVVMFADEDETRSVLFPPSLSSGPVNIPAF